MALVALLTLLLGPAVSANDGEAASSWADGIDLFTDISSSPPLPVPGGTAVVFVSIVNNGTETATNIELTISLATGLHLANEPGQGCTIAATSVTCPIAFLNGTESNENRSASYLLELDQLALGTYPITSDATADQTDADGITTDQLDLVVVPESADLTGISRTDEVGVGSTYPVAHIFRNNGPTAVAEASVAGTFPAAAQLVPGSFVFGTGVIDYTEERCDLTATSFECRPLSTHAALSTDFVQEYVQYQIVLPDTPQTIEASATITGRNDPDPTNNTSTLTIVVEPDLAELRVSFEFLRPTAFAGQTFTVGGGIENVGQSTADDVVVTFSASAGWTVSPWPGDQADDCAAGDPGRTVVCRYDSLGPGGITHPLFQLTGPIEAPSVGTVTVEVTTTSPEVGTYPNTASGQVQVVPLGADLVGDPGTATPASTRVDRQIDVTWRFHTASTDRVAEGVRVHTQLPPGVTLRRLTESHSPGTLHECEIDPTTNQGECPASDDGYFWPGQYVEVTAWVTAEVGGSFALTASISQTSPEVQPGDESSTAVVDVAPVAADLRVAVDPPTVEVAVGEVFSYGVGVVNAGPDATTGITLDADAVAGVEILSVKRGWFSRPCSAAGAIHCQMLRDEFVVVTARALAAGDAATTFTASAARPDPDPASNVATVAITVVEPEDQSPVDLAVTIPDPPADPVAVGETFTTTVAVNNFSARFGTGVVVTGTDDGSDRLEVVSARIGWFGRGCFIGTVVECSIGSLPPRGATFVILTLRAMSPGAFDTTFSVSGDQPDPVPSSNAVHLTGTAVAA